MLLFVLIWFRMGHDAWRNNAAVGTHDDQTAVEHQAPLKVDAFGAISQSLHTDGHWLLAVYHTRHCKVK